MKKRSKVADFDNIKKAAIDKEIKAKVRKNAAIKIQKIMRGFLDRKVA